MRELENIVERAILLSRSRILTVDDLPADFARCDNGKRGVGSSGHVFSASAERGSGDGSGDGKVASLREALEEPERQIILEALRMFQWNRAATADALEINRTTLYKKMKRLGLDDPRLQFSS